jgi:type II secretion system protein J
MMNNSISRSKFYLNRPGGFTLLEILIAIAILALVVSSLYGAYSGTMETTEKVESVRNVDQVARLALVQLTDDFKSLYYEKAQEESEDSPYHFGGGREMEIEGEGGPVVTFVTTSHLGFEMMFPSFRINRVSYVLEKQGDSDLSYTLVRTESSFADLPGEHDETKVELADGVESLTLNYVDAEEQTFSQWDTEEAESEGLLPRLVQIRLEMAGESPRVFTTSVAIGRQVDEGSGEQAGAAGSR